MNKKVFLKIVLIFAVSLCWAAQTPQIPLPGTAIPQFVQPLPILSAAGGTMTTYVDTGLPFEIHMREFKSMMLPAGVVPGYPGTWVWGYIVGSTVPTTLDTYIGPVIVATRNQASQITFYNDLGDTSSTNVLAWKYSTDQTMHWADPLNLELNTYTHVPVGGWPFGHPGTLNYGEDTLTPGSFLAEPIPAVVHLHGGEVPPVLDGGPDAWVTSDGAYSGHGYWTWTPGPFNQGDPAPGNFFQYNYPNTQEAANIWFHDHVLGITRLNVYAGLAGAYVLVDPANPPPGDLDASDPNNAAKIVPVVIQDRMFDTNGQLFFPADSAGGVLWTTNPEHPYWVPEFLGDVIVVNGKAWPYLEVQPALYRLLFINGSNARTYTMWIDNPVTGVKAPWWVIGTDGGYLNNPVKINKLTMMPGERYDVIVDFRGLTGNFVLHNNARTPFPKGVPPTGPITLIMQFRVNPAATTAPITFDPALGTALRPAMVRLPGTPLGPAATGTNVQLKRQLTLNEVMGPPQIVQDPVTGVANTAYPGGPLEVVLNNTKWSGNNPLGLKANPSFIDYPPAGSYGPVYYSELPTEGTTEQWEIINITADAHPIHLHLVQFQIMNRQNFNVNKYWGDYQLAFDGGGIDPMTGQPYPAGVFMP
ncbi:MAG: multicopper oxidase domain-containing protein, partial [Candidatus Aminicenantes bacterium]|nr:multicopper oxidase domain-containing protein [Candidatus Aminicenantes bacterium]